MVNILVITLLLNIPTSILNLYAALSMQGLFVPLRTLAKFGAICGILLTIYRNVSIPFPTHIILYGITLVLLLKYLSKASWGMAVLCGLAAHLINAVGEGLITAPVFMAMGISLQNAVSNQWLVILGGWLGNLLLIMIVTIIKCQRQAKTTVQE